MGVDVMAEEKKKRVSDNKLKTCMIVQQMNEEFFDWTDEELASIKKSSDGNASFIADVIGKRLQSAGMEIAESYTIIHNSDVRKKWDDVSLSYVIEKKPNHFHMVIKFVEGCEQTAKKIANAVGVEMQFVEKAGKGRFAYDNMLAYLIHSKYEDKFQYDSSAVYSACYRKDKVPFKSYEEIYSYRREDWLVGKSAVKKQKADIGIDFLEEMILTGQVSKSEVLLTDDYYNIYSRNSRRCEDAFRVYGERRAYKTLNALERGEFKLSVFFITGIAGSGKTRLAKAFVNSLIKSSADYSEEWRVCQTAATNPMDEYNGEEILLMDDVRGSAMTASDWLKLLDPYNISPSSARYRNRTPACRVIVITSTKEPIEFFYYCKQMGGGDRSEALDQFMRRIQCLTRVIKSSDFADTTAMISEGKSGRAYNALVGEESVSLTYKFNDEKKYTFNEAVDILVEKTLANNFLNSEDGQVSIDDVIVSDE